MKIVLASQLLERSCAIVHEGRWLAQIGWSDRISPADARPGFEHQTLFVRKWNGNFSYVDAIVLVATIWPRLCSLPCRTTSSLEPRPWNWTCETSKKKLIGRVPAYKIKRSVNSVILHRYLHIKSWHIFLSTRYIAPAPAPRWVWFMTLLQLVK